MDSEDRDRLIRIDERMGQVLGRMDDHGKRLRALEVARNVATGISMATMVVLGWLKVKVSVQ